MFRKKSILISTWCFPPDPGGVSNVTFAHAAGLAELGHEVTVATAYNPDRNELSNPKNLCIVQFDVRGGAKLRQGYHGCDIGRYRKYIADFKGDVIIFETWAAWNTELALESFSKTSAKKILISHGVSFNGFGVRNWLNWLPYKLRLPDRWKYFDYIVFLSGKTDNDRFYDKQMAEQNKFTNWTIIPNGTYPDNFNVSGKEFREKFNIGNKKIILYVAAYSPLKNQKMVLRAFFRANPEEAVLVFIGDKINKYARQLQLIYLSLLQWHAHEHFLVKAGKQLIHMVYRGIYLLHRVSIRMSNSEMRPPVFISNLMKKFTGSLEQIYLSSIQGDKRVLFLEKLDKSLIRSAYRASDLFLCSSQSEVQPLVILDAMASGTPFISTDVGCVSELPGGIIVKSEQEMALNIRELLNDKEKHNELSKAGSAACAKKYNWKTVTLLYDQLINNLIEN